MKKIITAAIVAATFGSAPVSAQDLSITITNLTHGLTFTPVLVAAHDASGNLFDIGTAASASLTAMAEGGDLAALETDLDGISATHANSGGMLSAGANVIVPLNTDSAPTNTKLSVVAMLLPTNDGFLGLDAIDIPTTAGTYTYNLNAYDAGTEANNELVIGMPGGAPGTLGIPGGSAETGGTVGVAGPDGNMTVHIHRGAIGDDNPTGGNSDLNNTVHRWLNPVARVTVVVN